MKSFRIANLSPRSIVIIGAAVLSVLVVYAATVRRISASPPLPTAVDAEPPQADSGWSSSSSASSSRSSAALLQRRLVRIAGKFQRLQQVKDKQAEATALLLAEITDVLQLLHERKRGAPEA